MPHHYSQTRLERTGISAQSAIVFLIIRHHTDFTKLPLPVTRIRESSSNVRKFAFFFHSKLSLGVVTAMCMRVVWKKTFSISNQFQSTKVSRKWTNFRLVGIDFPHNIKRRATSFFYSRAVTTAVKWTMQISKSEQFYTLPIYKWQCTIWWFFATSCLPTQGEYGDGSGGDDDERNRKFRVYSSSRARHILSSRWCIINWMTNCSPVLASRINLCVSIYLKQLHLCAVL